jgi:hypothetical protein
MGAARIFAAAGLLAVAAAVGGCSGDGAPDPPPAGGTEAPSAGDPAASSDPEQQYPNIVAATLIPRSAATFDLEVTVSSPYDTAERYADGWRVLTPDGAELGSHTLLHDHAGEQPFTRRQRDLAIPVGVTSLIVQGRDLVHGYGGGTVEVAVPGR